MSGRVQSKLLRALQDRRIRRVGDLVERPIDIRLIGATNAQLKTLRPDLVYRLNTLTITIPPLRERREDIPLLAEYFLDQLNHKYGRGVNPPDHAECMERTDDVPPSARLSRL